MCIRDRPEGEQFECDGCGNWGHVECYAEYRSRFAAKEEEGGEASASDQKMYCQQCMDSWRGGEHASEAWYFSCVCGRNEGASNETVGKDGCDAPTGRMFACHGCSVWAHTECFEEYRGVDDEVLPEEMWCHRCRNKGLAPPELGVGMMRSGGKNAASTTPTRSPRKRTVQHLSLIHISEPTRPY